MCASDVPRSESLDVIRTFDQNNEFYTNIVPIFKIIYESHSEVFHDVLFHVDIRLSCLD